RPVLALESSQAAGVVAALALALRLGHGNAVAFDMGGTTAKASLIEDGAVSRAREYEVGGSLSTGSRLMRGSGELLRIPSIDIAEVGAGGGSVVWLGYIPTGPLASGDLAVSRELAEAALERIAAPLGLPLAETAAGVHALA